MKKYAAEFAGTFALVFAGVGSAVLAGSEIGVVGVSLAFGLCLMAMAYALGPVSGCHVNPAVSVGLFAARRMRGGDLAGYVVAQCLGAVSAAAFVFAIARGGVGGYSPSLEGLGANGYGLHSPGGFGMGAAFLTEAVLTGLLVFTVLGATEGRIAPGLAGIPIGFCLTLVHLIAIPVTNASVNPARSLASALFAGGWALEQLWLFILAPIVGALAAAAAYRGLGETRIVRALRDRRRPETEAVIS